MRRILPPAQVTSACFSENANGPKCAGPTSAARKPQEDGTKTLELIHGELAVSEQDQELLSSRDVEAAQKVQPNLAHPVRKHRRTMANREVSVPYWGLGRGLNIKPDCPGDAGSIECKESGADATAGEGTRDEVSVAVASDVSAYIGKRITSCIFLYDEEVHGLVRHYPIAQPYSLE